jgi:hypothetical protein
MLKNVCKGIAIFIAFCFSGLILNGLNLTHSNAQETEQTLQALLNEMGANEITIIVRFVTPIGDAGGWVIPEFTTEGDTAGSRTLYKVGSDYFCVRDSGHGSREIRCIPFSNISEISYTQNS